LTSIINVDLLISETNAVDAGKRNANPLDDDGWEGRSRLGSLVGDSCLDDDDSENCIA
jgi:hypothetical protein